MFFWFSNVASASEPNSKWIAFLLSISVGRMAFYAFSKATDKMPNSLFNSLYVEHKKWCTSYKNWFEKKWEKDGVKENYENWCKQHKKLREAKKKDTKDTKDTKDAKD